MNKFWRFILILSLLGNLGVFYVAMKALEYRNHINFFLDKYTTVVKEFSQRSVYADQNAKLVSDTTIPNRIVFLGTQVIERWKVDSLFAPEYHAINRGVFGQRAAGLLLRFKPDVIDVKPVVVFIEISSYNFRSEVSVQEIKDYLESLATLAKANNITPVLTTTIPFRDKQYELEGYQLGDSVQVYNAWIREYAKAHSFPIVDCNALLQDSRGFLREDLSFDDIDPNEAGYQLLTQATQKALAEIAHQ